MPRSLTVVGAGVIGIEYATIFSALDVPVTLIEPRENFLEFIDREIIDEFVHDLRKRGMVIRLGSPRSAAVEQDDQGWPKSPFPGGRPPLPLGDAALCIAGRVGATAELGLENCGLKTDGRGRLTVDPATFQTEVPHIYAAGDVIGFPSLASTSMEQGRIAAGHAFGLPMPPAPQFFPYGIYAVPEISTVGMSEEEVRSRRASPANAASPASARPLAATSWGCNAGHDEDDLRPGGPPASSACTSSARSATELIHIGQAVLNLKGTIDYFIENTFNYPTLAEAYKIAALDAWNPDAPHPEATPRASTLAA